MPQTALPPDDRGMNHPLMLLGPGGLVAFSRRARWTILLTALTLLVLCAALDPGPGRTSGPWSPAPVVTTVSATTVPAPACPPADTGCRP
jgi:hypothetical protein